MEINQRTVVLQLGALITLYLSVTFTITIVFGVITTAIPSPADSSWEVEQAASSIRWGIAMVVVFFPTYLYLTRLIQRYRRESTNALYQPIIKWLVYLSLLLGGLLLLGTLVSVLYTFLNGDITLRFLLKAGIMCIVLALACFYYLKDAQGYWVKHETQSLLAGGVAILIALIAIVAGFLSIDSPQTVREMRIDTEQVNDLRTIQFGIEEYLRATATTTAPASLAMISEFLPQIPSAPVNRPAYEYEQTDTGFTLCATFKTQSTSNESIVSTGGAIIGAENWLYSPGRTCFNRRIATVTGE